MPGFETIGTLRAAITEKTLPGMSDAGYFFLDQALNQYLAVDLENQTPTLPWQNLALGTPGEYVAATDQMSLPPEFWGYLATYKDLVLFTSLTWEGISRRPFLSSSLRQALTCHHQHGGEDLAKFLQQYQPATDSASIAISTT